MYYIYVKNDNLMGIRQAVRHGILIPAYVGSNPTCPVRGLLGSPTLDLVVPFTLIVESC